MCVFPMISDSYYDKWQYPWNRKPYYPGWPFPPKPLPADEYWPEPAKPKKSFPSQEEIDEFHELIRKAREYNKKNSKLAEKKDMLKKLADELGIKINFD